jgi:hypothetical protein
MRDPHGMRNERHWGFEYGIRINGFHACIE